MNKKGIIFPFLIALIAIAFIGCSSQAENQEPIIIKVSVSKSNNIGVISKDFFVTYEDKDTLTIFESLIAKASKQGGIANMATPHYDVELTYSNGHKQSFHLWLGQKGQSSTIMYVDDTHTVYIINDDITDQLVDIIQAP